MTGPVLGYDDRREDKNRRTWTSGRVAPFQEHSSKGIETGRNDRGPLESTFSDLVFPPESRVYGVHPVGVASSRGGVG